MVNKISYMLIKLSDIVYNISIYLNKISDMLYKISYIVYQDIFRYLIYQLRGLIY